MVSFSQKRDLMRDKGENNKRKSMPSNIRLGMNSEILVLLRHFLYLGRGTTASDMPKANSFRIITDRHILGGGHSRAPFTAFAR
jgi:hypothetical protein